MSRGTHASRKDVRFKMVFLNFCLIFVSFVEKMLKKLCKPSCKLDFRML